MRNPMEALDAACDRAGSQSALAESLTSTFEGTVTSQGISDWRRRGIVPESRGAQIEFLTGIRAEILCPQVEWIREDGRITCYRPWPVQVSTPDDAQRRRGAGA